MEGKKKGRKDRRVLIVNQRYEGTNNTCMFGKKDGSISFICEFTEYKQDSKMYVFVFYSNSQHENMMIKYICER